MIGGAPARLLVALLAGAFVLALFIAGLWLFAETVKFLWYWFVWIGEWAGWV